MPIATLKELKMHMTALKSAGHRHKRIMGIDHSKKAWGLAISNPDLTLATPLQTIVCTKFSEDIKKVYLLCKEYEVAGFIIGLPLNMDGSEGSRSQSVRHFAENLLKEKDFIALNPCVAFYDERLSTSAASDFLDEQNHLSSRNKNEIIDQIAAKIILQEALDAMKRI